MKTLTEFNGTTLKTAAQAKKDLVAAGKTAEELPQAMGEALKLEGDKLTFVLAALELVEAKHDDLKRVVVFALAEGEKAPHGAELKNEKYFMAEYYPPLHPPKGRGDDRHDRGDRGGKRGGGRGDKRGRGGRDDKKGRGRGPRRDGEQQAGPGSSPNANPGANPRPPRGPRPPRNPDNLQAAGGKPKLPVPLPKPLEKPKAPSPSSAAPEAAATTSTAEQKS